MFMCYCKTSESISFAIIRKQNEMFILFPKKGDVIDYRICVLMLVSLASDYKCYVVGTTENSSLPE